MNIKSPQQVHLERYERVNKCETLEELQQCILDFADENGEMIIYTEGAEEIYKDVPGFDLFDSFVPYGEYGIHTIESIEIITEGIKLL